MRVLNRFYYRFIKIKSFIKAKIFQLRHGFDYRDSWNLDYSLAEWVVPRLKYLKENKNSVPVRPGGKMTEHDPECLTEQEWNDILDKIIFAFEFVLNEDKIQKKCYPKDYNFGFDCGEDGKIEWKDDRKPDWTYYEQELKKHEEGLKLFVEFFRSLWD